MTKIEFLSFMLYVHKVQVIPDLTGNEPNAPPPPKKNSFLLYVHKYRSYQIWPEMTRPQKN